MYIYIYINTYQTCPTHVKAEVPHPGPHITDVLRYQVVGVRKQAEAGHLLQGLQTVEKP